MQSYVSWSIMLAGSSVPRFFTHCARIVRRYGGFVYTTISVDQRRDLMGQIDHFITTDLPFYMMLYSGSTYLVNRRITGSQSDSPWNSHEWDISRGA